jgi:hypothetical protein
VYYLSDFFFELSSFLLAKNLTDFGKKNCHQIARHTHKKKLFSIWERHEQFTEWSSPQWKCETETGPKSSSTPVTVFSGGRRLDPFAGTVSACARLETHRCLSPRHPQPSKSFLLADPTSFRHRCESLYHCSGVKRCSLCIRPGETLCRFVWPLLEFH